ncbi:uncharacterized protein B0I36DRAFT_265937 [Microdochium trichocladiopsis]|uniref:Association with the SNF1 complex (ASC) domain-containing protein n=1 Tax=Microdochium trichocladiopsis TaxID=1682393 RepID=A0A9P9BRH0_9PEZI|nr:uncharacterized protein B0I36DRAFT_265937 [Microdochium trichocladiopsis]KAH7032906.1 hypothetical protein B0I36DRAFT_265937 [Microdochium trichocladiopsis]
MGNSPSSSRGATPTSASHHGHQHTPSSGAASVADSPRASKKEPKSLTSLQHTQRSAASPEASVVQATGSTISSRTSQSRPLSILTSSSPSTSVNHTPASSGAPSRSSESKSRPVSEFRAEPSKPVDVPAAHSDAVAFTAHESHFGDSGLISGLGSSSVQDMSYIQRPPRLPLPIEEEIHTPGSPIIAAEDIRDDIDAAPLDKEVNLPRRASGLSNATDEDDSEELRVDKTRPTVPTRVEWLGGGQKVYVTGTPFQWSRKQRLNPVPGREGVLETVIPVFPGTHHLKFLVDGNMQTSPDLPTTVDFGNNLVNYIEVSGEDAAANDVVVDLSVPKSSKEAADLPSRSGSTEGLKSGTGAGEKKPQLKVIEPADVFTPALPSYLTDFDQPEESAAYTLAMAALDKLPMPPALPGFLSKPILNNTTLIKDDNSVLNMPNHTVLNHLGTCSIKNNVLAVSATTRYRNKYVTTIIYKPTD